MRPINLKFSLFPDFPTCQKEHCDYRGVDNIIALLEDLDVCSITGFILLDFCNREVLFHSTQISFLPFPIQTFLESDYILQNHPLLHIVNRTYLTFLNQLPIEERKHCILSGNILLSSKNHSKQVFQNIKPLRLDASGNIFLLLCSLYYPERNSIEFNPHIRYHDQRYFFSHGRWQQDPLILNFREKHILRLSIQGFTQSEIATRVHLSIDSVKKIKQQLFEKLAVNNIHDAIHVAENQKLL